LTAFFFSQLLFAEGAILDAIVTRQTIVVLFMESALYAKQVACGTLRLAEPDAGTKVYHRAVDCSAQFFNASILGLETLCVRLHPLFDVSNTEVDEMSQVLPEVRDPFRVINVLPGPRPIPGFNQD
jgi:hypothetical protein